MAAAVTATVLQVDSVSMGQLRSSRAQPPHSRSFSAHQASLRVLSLLRCFAATRTSSIVWVGSFVSSITLSRRNFMATCHSTQHQKHTHFISCSYHTRSRTRPPRRSTNAPSSTLLRAQPPHLLLSTSRSTGQEHNYLIRLSLRQQVANLKTYR
jgi:hypothetical protein